MPPKQKRRLDRSGLRGWTVVAVLAVGWYTLDASADDARGPTFSFGGFGTLGAVHSSEGKADFVSSVLVPSGAGHSHAWSGDVDSRLAVQGTAGFTPQVSAVVQVISEQRYDGSYTPTVEWANVKYQFSPDASVRAGRIVLPAFLVSDYRKVGYANPWVRPPLEVYTLIPISNSDGVDASYRMHLGAVTNTAQGTFGKAASKLPAGAGNAEAKDAWGITDTAEFGAAAVRVTYHRARVKFDAYRALFNAFTQFGPQGVALADRYDPEGKPLVFMGLGGSVDPGGWFATGEWGFTRAESALGRRAAWYASSGYRWGKFTPYLTYARSRARSNTSDPGLTLSTLPPFLAGPAAGLNAGLNALLGSIPVQTTGSIGCRWDFAKSAALKLQFDAVRLGAGSNGTLGNIQTGFQPGGKVDVISATIDFLY